MTPTGTLVIEQPSFAPWLGYFELMAGADTWVWYDDVDYTRRDWRNRNRLAREGPARWMTVPVRARRGQPICEVDIDYDRPWARKHLETLRHCCRAAPFLEPTMELLRSAFEARPQRLADLVVGLNEAIAAALGLRPRFLRSSTLASRSGHKQERLLAICRELGATTYLSGPRARDYIDPGGFRDLGVALQYIDYPRLEYPRGGLPFVERLSVLDPLCWIGAAATAALLAACRTDEARC